MSNLEKNTFFAVAFLHLLIVLGIFFEFQKPAIAPVLSFSVTMLDIASSPGNISVAAVANSKSNKVKTSQDLTVDQKNDLSETKKKKQPEPSKDSNTKSKSDNVVNSIQQNAVFAPTTPAIFSASYLQNPTPPYPPLSRRLNEQGLVILNVYVNKDGKAERVTIFKSSGFSRLDNSALNTVKNWRFVAAKRGEQLVPSEAQVPINFILESNE